jgi:branched-subunit amino acid aminotransferase/4-amino-4-deoxychorismate lyase
MSEPIAFWRNSYVPLSQVKLAINDAGFVLGATVTDLCRTFGHQLFRLEDHLQRFHQSCAQAHVPHPWTDGQLAAIAQELVEHNTRLLAADDDLALVMFATPGEIGYYLGQPGGPGDAAPTLCMHTFPLPFARYAPLMQRGARLIVPQSERLAVTQVLPSAKHRSRLHWWLAEQEVHAVDPRASALIVQRGGYITETATANFLVVRDGKVYSPQRVRILPGISLDTVEDLCWDLGIDFEELDLNVTDWVFRHPHEAMLTSTPYCITPVSRIDDRAIPSPGPVFEALLQAWSQMVGVDIRGQILHAAAPKAD